MTEADKPLYATVLYAAAGIAVVTAALMLLPQRRFHCAEMESNYVLDSIAPGCRTGEYGNGLAYDPCRSTFEWSCNRRDAVSRAFAKGKPE